MPTIAQDMGRGYKRSLVVSLVSLVIGLPLGLCGVMSTLLLVTTYDFQPWTLVVAALMWIGPFGIAAALFVASIRRRTRKLDALFAPLGLEGTAYMSYFRQYHGTIYGRQTAAFLWRGPVLQIEIETALGTRLGITEHQSDTDFFAGIFGKQPLALAAPELSSLRVYAADEAWARALLADPLAADALRRLTRLGSSVFTRQQVILRPGALFLMLTGNRRLFGIDLTAEQARLWVDDLTRVLQVAEGLPAPTVGADLSAAEQLALKMRDRNPYFELWVGLGIFGFFAVMGIIIFAGVFLLTGLTGP